MYRRFCYQSRQGKQHKRRIQPEDCREGLAFLQEYLDKAVCILPSGKDPWLAPIKSKADIPQYQVIMKNYFSILNPMAFLNVNQDGGRVIKGSAIMGFSLDPKECLNNVAGDLQMMGCSLF
jgi:hypothetical protein